MSTNKREELLFLALIAPFLLNDITNIYVGDWRAWLVIDFVLTKIYPLGFVAYLIKSQRLSFADLKLSFRASPRAIAVASLVIVGGVGFSAFSPFLWLVFGREHVGQMPVIPLPFGYADKYIGLIFVALVEEIVFRALPLRFLREKFTSEESFILVSSLIFGLIHWSAGISAMVHALVLGALFMKGTISTGSLLPAIVAHYFIDILWY